MTLRQFEHLHALHMTGSFSMAAVECGLRQWSVTESLRKLQEELGVQLIVSKTTHYQKQRLTPLGLQVLELAKKAIALQDEIRLITKLHKNGTTSYSTRSIRRKARQGD